MVLLSTIHAPGSVPKRFAKSIMRESRAFDNDSLHFTSLVRLGSGFFPGRQPRPFQTRAVHVKEGNAKKVHVK
jgi:hypothetical protein